MADGYYLIPVLVADVLEGHGGVLNGGGAALLYLGKGQLVLDNIGHSLHIDA